MREGGGVSDSRRKAVTPEKTRNVKQRQAMREAEARAYVEGRQVRKKRQMVGNFVIAALLVLAVVAWLIMFGMNNGNI